MSYRIKNKSTNREHHYESRHSGMKIRKNVTLVIRPMNRETAEYLTRSRSNPTIFFVGDQ